MNSQDLIIGKKYSIRKPAHWSRSKQKTVVAVCLDNNPPKFRHDDVKLIYTDFIFSKLEVSQLPDKPAPKPKAKKQVQKEMCLSTTTAAQRKRHAKLLKAK
jgi:hypothetical protein